MQTLRRRFLLKSLPLLVLLVLFYCHQISLHLRAFPLKLFTVPLPGTLGYRLRFLSARSQYVSKHFWLEVLEPSTAILSTANATLGFGAVVAVSHTSSPRREGLLWAANLTGVDITVPEQPLWTEGDIATFTTRNNESKITRGSALAWLGHLNALQWFLSTSHQTALIIEDDVDWDVLIRHSQIPLAAAAVRSSLSPDSYSPLAFLDQDNDYWSPSSSWEMLWLGHCGDKASRSHIISHPHLGYHDGTVSPHNSLDLPTSDILNILGMPEEARLVHRSYWPLCTFAYAVNRASAQRILDEYSTEGEGGCEAYDVRLLEACRDDDWLCYTITPELFHHIEAPSEIAHVNADAEEETVQVEKENMKSTTNIRCGARHPSMRIHPDDIMMRAWMLERVRKGECMINWGAEDMAGSG